MKGERSEDWATSPGVLGGESNGYAPSKLGMQLSSSGEFLRQVSSKIPLGISLTLPSIWV